MIAGIAIAVLVGVALFAMQFIVKPLDVKKLYEEAQEREKAKKAAEK